MNVTVNVARSPEEAERQARGEEILERDTHSIDDLGLEMLAQKHDGWENGDGAFGELTIDIAARKAVLEHSVRITETECFTHEWGG